MLPVKIIQAAIIIIIYLSLLFISSKTYLGKQISSL